MNKQTAANIAAIERMMKHGQAIPSKMLRDLITDCKAFASLDAMQKAEIEILKAKLQPEAQS
jgi:hypothetical protein